MNEAEHSIGRGAGSGPSPGPGPDGDPDPTTPGDAPPPPRTPPATPPTPPTEMRRLYREPEEKRLAGVCGGLADYIGVDPTIVRLAVVLLTFMTGVVIVGYVIAAIVVPTRPASVPRRVAPHDPTSSWSTGTKVLAAVVAVVLVGFVRDVGWWFDVPMVAVALVLVGVWLLVSERNRPDGGFLGGSTTQSEKTWRDANAWSAGTTTLVPDRTSESDDASSLGAAGLGDAVNLGATGSVDAAGAVGDQASDDDQATTVVGAASDHGAVSAGPQGEVPPPVPPWGVGSPATPAAPSAAQPPPHPRPGRGAGLPLGVLAALFIGAGILSLFAVLDIGDIDPVDALAGALLLVGAAMVLGAWRGNARPLIGFGLPLVGLLLVADTIDMPLDAGAGDRTRIIDSVAELDETYQLTAGELTLDLGDLPLGPRTRSSPPTLRAEMAFGHLVVIVPRDANVDVDAHVAGGDIIGSPDGHDDDGVGVRERFDMDGDEGGGRLVLDLEVGLGEIEVRRA